MLVYRTNKRKYIDLCNCIVGGSINDSVENCNLYTVGEKDEKYPYNGIIKMYMPKNDMYIQASLKKGYLFEKYVTMAIFAFCEKGDIIFDVGANFGSVTLPCAKWFHVHAFEPFDLTYEILKKNVKINNVEDNVTIHHVAVGHTQMLTHLSSKIKLVDFYTRKQTEQDITPYGQEEVNYGGIQLGSSGQRVDMITLDDLTDTINIPKISLMKVDVEGAEPLVFYGAKKLIERDKPIIVFEKNWQEVTEDMKESMKLSESVVKFDIFTFCKQVGYDKILHLRSDDYVLIPPNRKRVHDDKLFQYWRIEDPNDLGNIINEDIKGFQFYKLLRIGWDRTYEKINIDIDHNSKIKLSDYDHAVFSSDGQDGIINAIFTLINKISSSKRFFIEFNVKDGVMCNSRYLREYENWDGLSFDKKYKNKYINLYREKITPDNIVNILNKYNARNEIDFVSVQNIDNNDEILKNIVDKFDVLVIAKETQQKINDYKYVGSDKSNKTKFFIRNNIVDKLNI
jgi:FkbM family methyltransferase